MSFRLRTLALVAVALAVWLFAGRASAAAPLCDDRGAIMLAPAPILDAPASSVDIGDGADGCAYGVDQDLAYNQGRGSNPAPTPLHPYVTLPASVAVVFAPPPSITASRAARDAGETGVRCRLERPPRG